MSQYPFFPISVLFFILFMVLPWAFVFFLSASELVLLYKKKKNGRCLQCGYYVNEGGGIIKGRYECVDCGYINRYVLSRMVSIVVCSWLFGWVKRSIVAGCLIASALSLYVLCGYYANRSFEICASRPVSEEIKSDFIHGEFYPDDEGGHFYVPAVISSGNLIDMYFDGNKSRLLSCLSERAVFRRITHIELTIGSSEPLCDRLGFQQLVFFGGVKNIECFSLALGDGPLRNQTKDDLEYLLSHFQEIETLVVANAKVNLDGHISSCNKLTTLTLGGCDFTGSWSSMKNIESLEKIVLVGTGRHEQQLLEQISKSLPNVEVSVVSKIRV